MVYCRNCGTSLDESVRICPECGAKQYERGYDGYPERGCVITDRGGFLWGLLGFMVPPAALALYLIWRDEKPNNAKAVGIGGLISIGTFALTHLLFFLPGLLYFGLRFPF